MPQNTPLSLPTTPATAPHLAVVLAALLLAHAVVDALAALVPASLGLLEVRIGITAKQSAWLLGIGPLVSGLSQPLCALLSDRQHTRLWGIVGLALAGVGICLLGLAPQMSALVAIYAVGMIGVGMFHPVAATTIGQLQQHQRHSAMSLFFVSGMLGGVLGAFCWPRFLTTSLGFDLLPAFMVPVFLLAVVIHWKFLRLPAPQTLLEQPDAESSTRSNWSMIGLLYVVSCFRFCVNLSLFYLYVRWAQAAVAAEHPAWSPSHIAHQAAPVVGELNAATLFGMAVGGLLAGRFVRGGREKLPMVLVPVLFAPVIAGFPYVSLGLGRVLAGLAGIGFASMIPISIALAQKNLPHRANLASSLMMGGAWAVAMLAPPLTELCVARWGIGTSFLIIAVTLAVSGLLCLPLRTSKTLDESLQIAASWRNKLGQRSTESGQVLGEDRDR